jgi:hypothetical protein
MPWLPEKVIVRFFRLFFWIDDEKDWEDDSDEEGCDADSDEEK